MASQIALANRDFRQAEEIARKAVEANPDDFQARVWLAQVLMEGRKPTRPRPCSARRSTPPRPTPTAGSPWSGSWC